MAITLWTRHRTEPNLDVKFVTIFHGILTNELSSIARDDDAGYVVPCYNIALYELTYLLIRNGAECFCFHILGEIIDGENNELSLSFS